MAWDAKKLSKQLVDLCQLDIDAVRAYEQALKNIDVTSIYDQINAFRQDHERHVNDLSAEIRQLGETPPEYKADLKGFFIQGFTAIRSMTGTEGALKAMQGNEKLTNKTYKDALDWDMPDKIRTLLEKNYADEQRHLAYIEKTLDLQSWERAEHVTSR